MCASEGAISAESGGFGSTDEDGVVHLHVGMRVFQRGEPGVVQRAHLLAAAVPRDDRDENTRFANVWLVCGSRGRGVVAFAGVASAVGGADVRLHPEGGVPPVDRNGDVRVKVVVHRVAERGVSRGKGRCPGGRERRAEEEQRGERGCDEARHRRRPSRFAGRARRETGVGDARARGRRRSAGEQRLRLPVENSHDEVGRDRGGMRCAPPSSEARVASARMPQHPAPLRRPLRGIS